MNTALEYETLVSPVILDLLEPATVYIGGLVLYIDQQTKKIIPRDVMEQYNQHIGAAGYDEDHDDQREECGDVG